MSSKLVCISQIIFFFLLIAAYLFLATRKNSSVLMRLGEIATLYGATFFFAFSKTISTIVFLLTACGVVIFNINKAKNERRTKGLSR